MTLGDEDLAVQRAIGRLEGQIEFLVARIGNYEAQADKRFEILGKQLLDLRETVTASSISGASDKGRLTGGWNVLVIVASGILSIASLLIALFKS